MNPMMKEILKQELQKLLQVGFIYPISDSQWVSPLVVVPTKNGNWRICVDYRELNKARIQPLAENKFFRLLLIKY